ncbi:MAG: hypothetical protein JWN34_661 [Bryobacterales bacterium]|nr:hypothetical protein [Bryobacterales bacterium]
MDDTTKTRPHDAQRININERYELQYWTEKFGCTIDELKAAVAKVGVMAADVERELGRA